MIKAQSVTLEVKNLADAHARLFAYRALFDLTPSQVQMQVAGTFMDRGSRELIFLTRFAQADLSSVPSGMAYLVVKVDGELTRVIPQDTFVVVFSQG